MELNQGDKPFSGTSEYSCGFKWLYLQYKSVLNTRPLSLTPSHARSRKHICFKNEELGGGKKKKKPFLRINNDALVLAVLHSELSYLFGIKEI